MYEAMCLCKWSKECTYPCWETAWCLVSQLVVYLENSYNANIYFKFAKKSSSSFTRLPGRDLAVLRIFPLAFYCSKDNKIWIGSPVSRGLISPLLTFLFPISQIEILNQRTVIRWNRFVFTSRAGSIVWYFFQSWEWNVRYTRMLKTCAEFCLHFFPF